MPRLLAPLCVALCLALLGACSQQTFEPKDQRLFELRVYHPHEGKLEALHERFREHTLALFEKHGMQHVGYWVTDEDAAKLVYIVAFEDEAERDLAWANFVEDPEWKAAYAESIVDGRLVQKIDSTLMRTTDYSPAILQQVATPTRVFELRTYKASEGRLVHLDQRFRGATMDLFAKHGATNLVYFHPVESSGGAGDTLIYLLAHDSRVAREQMFRDFREDEEWKEVKAASEVAAGGPLTVKGGVKSVMLLPTDYSKIQ
ncbi:NIPSNAP family protein [Pelagicoccus sp. NFK12]|uniref:NIPSNAP family protein n=1 Tax=Pelagicoccus enzymogenes TaxID=2773457 RepID=A0A927IHZ8_9BACT|nr:NIPSNAP family protein [Pelagicoccus enzymogenes]MBD5780223.1 NIPSNAP family protein [Pelagicoccus enzymogenes]